MRVTRRDIGLAATVLSLTAAACRARAQETEAAPALPPWHDAMAGLDQDMAKVIAVLDALAPKPIETLDPVEARRQPGLSDALMKLAKHRKLGLDLRAGLDVTDEQGAHPLRFYAPQDVPKEARLPVIVYFRGGGWVIDTLDDYDASAGALARKAGAAVISVDYPLGPTDRFPAAHDAAVAVYRYVLKKAEGWGYDPRRIALVGEGAGGNLALNVAIAARDREIALPRAVAAIHPVATTAMDTPSKRENATAKPLNTAMLTWFWSYFSSGEADRDDPRLDLVSAKLRGLPPVTIVNAEIDPLKSDGDLLADKLREADVDTTHKTFAGTTHGFFGLDAVVAKAREAQDLVVAQLKRRFDSEAN